jgi:dTDP-glucose 4,6-dehydratase
LNVNLLVTGAAGFIGHHFVEHVLRTTDWRVTGLVSFRHRGCPLRLVHLADNPRLTLVRTDLGAPISDRVAREIGNIDGVVNFASESHVDRSITDPGPFVMNNVEIGLNMLEYARKAQPSHFIQFSTDEVYGPAPDGYAHKPWDAIIPSNPYSASKAAQEAMAIAWWRTYGVPITLVNSMNLIGERQDAEKFVPTVIRKVMAGEPVPVYGASEDQVGSRMYLHARNLADALCWLLRRPVTSYPSQDRPDRWHVVGEAEVNNLDMAKLIAKILDRPLKYELLDFHSARPGHDRRYALDGSGLLRAGYKQPMDFGESLRCTVRWTRDHPVWMVP